MINRLTLSKEILFRIFVPILAIVILLSVLELFARTYLSLFSVPQTHYDFRKTQPAPYKNASYFSKEFISESFNQPPQWNYPKGTRLIIPSDFRGTYFNVRNGIRLTAYQPDSFENTIYLFGGSTLYNSEVPDNLTIASQLQLRFNAHFKNKFIVRNYGTTTVTIAQQLERLNTISLKPNDIVVFYDGINDVYQGLFYANPEETMIERNRRVVKEVDSVHRVQLAVYRRWSQESSLIQICFDPVNRSFPAHLSDPAFVDELLISLSRRYKKTIEDADAHVTNSQAKFYHFLQPHLFADKTSSKYEKQLLKNHYIVPRGIDKAFQKGYPVLKTVVRQLPESISSYDLTEILNERPNNTEYFFDSCHVNHEANRIIATKIFDHIHRDLKLTQK